MIGLEYVRAALALESFDAADAQCVMAPQPRSIRRSTTLPGQPRKASVLLLLYPGRDGLHFVLTRRAHNPHDVHSGQISLPGGAREDDETPVATALRETREEIGVTEDAVEVLGKLTCLYIPPSDFEVSPFVGYTGVHPAWRPGLSEVVEVLEVNLAWLFDDTRKVTEDWHFGDRTLRIPWYNFYSHKVWGATAIILSEFEQRLRHVLGL